MWIFPRPLDQLTEADLAALITNQVRESVTLDYKRQMYGTSQTEIKKMHRDVAALANAQGGVLILGMDEDNHAVASTLVPVPNAEAEANRLIASCNASIAERIPGLRAVRVPVQGASVIVVQIPRSYRQPHMITFDGKTDFWIRHDRQNSRMSIAELRTALRATEDLAMKAEAFLEQRRQLWAPRRPLVLTLTATPLLLEDGRVDISDPGIAALLQAPPALRLGNSELTYRTSVVAPTVRGIASVKDQLTRLELFRNGHVEFVCLDASLFTDTTRGADARDILGWAVAEYVWNFLLLLGRLRQTASIVDPYLVGLAIWRCAGYSLWERGRGRFGTGNKAVWNEANDLVLDPVVSAQEAEQNATAKRIADRFWNAFGFMRCPFFEDGGQLQLRTE